MQFVTSPELQISCRCNKKKMLCEVLVTPHYNYCDVIYAGCSKKAKNNLQVNHNYAAKALLGRHKYSSGTEALKELKWLPLEERRKMHTAVFAHKAINGKSSEHAQNIVEKLKPQHNYRTRQKEKGNLHNQTHRTGQYKKSISYRMTQIWNEVPTDLKNMDSAASMKSKWQGLKINEFLTSN